MEEFQHYIYSIDCPASREEAAAVAEGNGAPDNLVQKIRNAKRKRFDNPNQVLQAVRGSL
jgi:Protein of unknown function (DUF2795)